MDSPGIALLGPLSVNGDAVVLSPRDRVVLAVLAIRPGEVVSAERLADALWGEHPPVSWNKVVPGCILRLRRALGVEAIETTPFGYRLALAADQVDIQRFERLLDRGRELLTLGEPERAQHTLDEALDLWRGLPLIDLDGWEPARIEAERLTELRLSTEECQLDAALRAGRHAEVLARARAGVAQAPLRERRWALLALAQYQSGHQGEALRTLQRARIVLVTELGLDPGPELAALEGAILRQDPALTVPKAHPDADAVCPYLGLFCYDIGDSETFFGRDIEVADCMRRLQGVRMLAVVGPSGSGKSSLVRAGIAAALERAGRRPFVVTAGSRPTSVLAERVALDTVLIVDQFEEVFTLCSDPDERARFFAGLAAEAGGCPVIISMRADRLGNLVGYPEIARLVERGLYLLGPMDEEGLRAAITGPAERAGLLIEPGLVDLLVREVEGEPGALPLLSHALRRTWERREGRILTVVGYQATGGIRGSIAQAAEQLYECLTADQRLLLRQILLRLVSTADEGEPVRIRVPSSLLLAVPERAQVVDRLVAARLVTVDQESIQIAHESLVRAWPRLSNWLEDDVQGHRILRHLTTSAQAWQDMGRPDSELYRGARLARALEWQRVTGPDLTGSEADFLAAGAGIRDAEREAATRQARQQTHARRRTGMLLSGVAALLVAALVTGGLALHQQRQREAADLAAAVAEASRVDDIARDTPEADRALLLALEAIRHNDSPDSRIALADLLSQHQALIHSITLQSPVQALEVSPDGKTLLVGEGDSGGTTAFDTGTLKRTGSWAAVPGWSMDYRADGGELLLVGRGQRGLGYANYEVSAALTDPGISDIRPLQIDGLSGYFTWALDAAYSADGNSFALAAAAFDDTSSVIDSAIAVWNTATPDRPVDIPVPLMAYAVALSPDGRLLYVATRDSALLAIEVATGQPVRSTPLSAATALLPKPTDVQGATGTVWDAFADNLEVSPDGNTVVATEGNDVVVFDAATLTERRRLREHSGLVRATQFSHDGTMVVSGADDGTAVVWELSTGRVVLKLTGHGDDVLALAFSPDDGTLYTGGLDKHVLVWDLTGRQRLINRIAGGTQFSTLGEVAVPSPDGTAVVYVGQTKANTTAQFLDVPTGQLQAPIANPDGAGLAVWVPPVGQRVVTAADSMLRVWDRSANRLAAENIATAADISALAASKDGRFVIVGDADGGVVRVDSGALNLAGSRLQLDATVSALAAGAGDSAIALLDDQTYVVVDLAVGEVLHAGDLGFKPTAAMISPDGGRLVVGGSTGELGLLELSTQDWTILSTTAHRQYVTGIAFSEDGRTLVTSSFDGGLRVWDGQTASPVAGVHIGTSHSPALVTFPTGGSEVVATARDGAVYRMDTRFEVWSAFACELAGRNLTEVEWQATFGDQPYRETCPA